MNDILYSKNYFVAPINSSKANQFTCYYHYSHVGFKKAKLNLGIFNKETKKLVGVSQWGCSAQEGIRLDRYVKEPITTEDYYELNRFCMADSEPRNSESQAIALSIKWIKKNQPHIQLLVSYAGRKEGNYGYIYQATNWEYLGYFVSSGFWQLDGQEVHQITVWYRYTHGAYSELPMVDALMQMHNTVIHTWTKQFIYIQRLNPQLTAASPILPYPKNPLPILEKTKIYKDEPYSIETLNLKIPDFYYDAQELLFSRRKLIRDGVLIQQQTKEKYKVAMYDLWGHLLDIRLGLNSFEPKYNGTSLKKAVLKNKIYKDHFFQLYPTNETEIPEEIDVPSLAIIDEIPFHSFAEIGRYCGVSRQAVHQAHARRSKQINKHIIIWVE